jgi:hypothetical protein
MPIRDVAAQNASLDNDYGLAHGAGSPDAHELALFNGDPMFDGVEITGPGYTPAPVPNDATWPDADGGAKAITVQYDASTDEWDEATHWALRDPDTGVIWDCGALTEPLDVTGPGDGPLVTATIFHPDSQTDL